MDSGFKWNCIKSLTIYKRKQMLVHYVKTKGVHFTHIGFCNVRSQSSDNNFVVGRLGGVTTAIVTVISEGFN